MDGGKNGGEIRTRMELKVRLGKLAEHVRVRKAKLTLFFPLLLQHAFERHLW